MAEYHIQAVVMTTGEVITNVGCHKHKKSKDQKNSNSLFCKNLDMGYVFFFRFTTRKEKWWEEFLDQINIK
jgi:hypothetical protein